MPAQHTQLHNPHQALWPPHTADAQEVDPQQGGMNSETSVQDSAQDGAQDAGAQRAEVIAEADERDQKVLGKGFEQSCADKTKVPYQMRRSQKNNLH